MNNIACRIFKEQIDLLTSLPNQEEAKTVLYQAVINSLNQFEKQNENQFENQFENAYVSESVSVSISVLGISILNLLSKNIIWKEFSNNYGGKRENSGRKSNTRQVVEEDNICLPYGELEDNSLKDKDKNKDKVKNNRYGECKNVLLTEEQYNKLSAENDNFELAVEKLDTWLGTSGSKNRNKNHFAYFKSNSWVWKDLKVKELSF